MGKLTKREERDKLEERGRKTKGWGEGVKGERKGRRRMTKRDTNNGDRLKMAIERDKDNGKEKGKG